MRSEEFSRKPSPASAFGGKDDNEYLRYNQLTFKQKQQLIEERSKKYITAPEVVRNEWNVFFLISLL